MKNTKIEWCDHTVNFWWGCSKVSEACANCYAEAMAKRFGKDCFGNSPRWYRSVKAVKEMHALNESAKRQGVVKSVFINSMSDLFDDDASSYARFGFYEEAAKCDSLVFLCLTKRASSMERDLANRLRKTHPINIPDNVHFGITTENQQRFDERMERLKNLNRKFFISCEPMLEPIDISAYAHKIDWVICGGENAPRAVCREFRWEWATSLLQQSHKANIPFFYKSSGKNFHGNQYDTAALSKAREFPAWHPKGAL